MILVSILGFSGTPDSVMGSKSTLDIALLVTSNMAAYFLGQTKKYCNFQQNCSEFMILLSNY